MANGKEERRRHFFLDGITATIPYRSRSGGARPRVPERDRIQHGEYLQNQIDALQPDAESAREVQQSAGIDEGIGLQVEFESFPDIELAFVRLAREKSGIELQNVRHGNNRTSATVFVPDGKLVHFENLIRYYLAEKRDKRGRPRDNRTLIDAISRIRTASLRALWTDDPAAFPADDEGPLWWEVWLPARSNRAAAVADFLRSAEAQEMVIGQGELRFPERTVLLVRASADRMRQSIMMLNSIAELRRAKETAEFFDSMGRAEQRE